MERKYDNGDRHGNGNCDRTGYDPGHDARNDARHGERSNASANTGRRGRDDSAGRR